MKEHHGMRRAREAATETETFFDWNVVFDQSFSADVDATFRSNVNRKLLRESERFAANATLTGVLFVLKFVEKKLFCLRGLRKKRVTLFNDSKLNKLKRTTNAGFVFHVTTTVLLGNSLKNISKNIKIIKIIFIM